MDRNTTLTGTGGGTAAAAAAPLARGATLGRYVVLDLLGSGAMGVVYSAYDFGLDRRVCLKLVALGPGAAAARRQERLLAEARAAARLNHPNVVAVYDVGTCAGQVFVAMELVEGLTLRQWLRAEDRPPPEILRVFADAARGLGAAHAAGLVHRDFKPDNVLVGADGRVRIADFGLALAAGGPEGDVGPGGSGTPVYMAPEQHRRDHVTAAADQYAFGVALQEALSGTRPFVGGTEPELLDAKLHRRICPGPRAIPRRVAAVLDRALAPDPARRYASMGALLSALGRKRRASLPAATGLTTAALLAALFLTAPAATREASASGEGPPVAAPERLDDTVRLARFPPRWVLPDAEGSTVPFPPTDVRTRDEAMASVWSPGAPGVDAAPWSRLLQHEAPAAPPPRRAGASSRRGPRKPLDPLLAFLEAADLRALADALRDWLEDAASGPTLAGYAAVGAEPSLLAALGAPADPALPAGRRVRVNVRAAEESARLERIRELEAKLSTAVTPEERAETQFLLAQELWETSVDRERALELAREAQLTLTLDGRTSTDLLEDVTDWLHENGLRGRGGTAY